MKYFLRFLSYIITALAACAVTLAVVLPKLGVTKLSLLEQLIESRFIGEYNKSNMEDAAAGAMIHALGDRWSYYLSAEEYAAHKEQTENAYVGIGITITSEPEAKGFRILSVTKDGSAMQAGLLPGDILISADGQNTAELTITQLRNIIRGTEGTTVQLEVLRGEEVLSFEVMRAQILTEVVTSQMLDGSIGHIAIANFDSRSAQDAIAAIEALREQGAVALIFDVRNNPGGYAHELVALLDYLLPEGDLFRTVDYAGNEKTDTSDAAFLDMPLAVLCDGDSYSAAEFFAAAIQEYHAGTIVGTPTCGKGYFQYTYELGDGSAVGLSVGKYFTPKGSSLIGTGVQPDVLIELDVETHAAILTGTLAGDDDPQIHAAAELLRR